MGVTNYTLPVSQRNLAQGNTLPPHVLIEVDAFPSWSDLSEINSDTVDFFWFFDNSGCVKKDSLVYLLNFKSPPKTIEFNLKPKDRIDSLYYFLQKAIYNSRSGEYEQGIVNTTKVLNLDSINFLGLKTITDILWKMKRFDDALRYATKAKSLVLSAADTFRAKGAQPGFDDAMTYVKQIDFFIDKCQKREPWQGGK